VLMHGRANGMPSFHRPVVVCESSYTQLQFLAESLGHQAYTELDEIKFHSITFADSQTLMRVRRSWDWEGM
jgi:hypothetical protein